MTWRSLIRMIWRSLVRRIWRSLVRMTMKFDLNTCEEVENDIWYKKKEIVRNVSNRWRWNNHNVHGYQSDIPVSPDVYQWLPVTFDIGIPIRRLLCELQIKHSVLFNMHGCISFILKKWLPSYSAVDALLVENQSNFASSDGKFGFELSWV